MSLLGRGLSLVWEAPQTLLGAAMLGAEAARKRIVNIEVEEGRLVVESRSDTSSSGAAKTAAGTTWTFGIARTSSAIASSHAF